MWPFNVLDTTLSNALDQLDTKVRLLEQRLKEERAANSILRTELRDVRTRLNRHISASRSRNNNLRRRVRDLEGGKP